MTKNNECEKILFTIKELDVVKSEDGSLNLKIKITDDIKELFSINEKIILFNGEKFKLTEREKEVLSLITKGKNNSKIARELCVSVHTVKAHLEAIYEKFEVTNRVQAVIKAVLLGLIDLNSLI